MHPYTRTVVQAERSSVLDISALPAGRPFLGGRRDGIVLVDILTDRLPWLKWIDRFSTALAAVAGVATVGLMINIVLDVVGRYFFSRPLPGTLDLSQYAWMPSLVSLALGYALLRGEHIRVNLLTAPTGPRTQRIIEIVGMTLTLATSVFFLWFSIEKSAQAMDFGEMAVGAHWLAIWPFRWVVAVGVLGLLLQSAAQLLRAVTVEHFVSSDADEVATILEAGEDVFEELEHESDLEHAPQTKKEMTR